MKCRAEGDSPLDTNKRWVEAAAGRPFKARRNTGHGFDRYDFVIDDQVADAPAVVH
jgi:hypothetical protein